jgi:Tol biopolymer transport system component
MPRRRLTILLFILVGLSAACRPAAPDSPGPNSPAPAPTEQALPTAAAILPAPTDTSLPAMVTPPPERTPTEASPSSPGEGLPGATSARSLLPSEALLHGFVATAPVDESALARPADAAPATHVFEGRLELFGEKGGGRMQVLRGELESDYADLPEFDFEFVQSDGYLIPVRRGLIIADHPRWNLFLEPGYVWQEAGDGSYSRASFPFALAVKGGNSSFNGTMTFLFDDQQVSRVWYQVTQETSSYAQANFWGLLDAAYHPGTVPDAAQIEAAFAQELAARLPTRPIEQLDRDYPGLDVSAFGRGVTAAHMTWYGVVVDGVNYLGGCQTRLGVYPYCESMRAASFSTAKSAFVSMALMRLALKYDPAIAGLLIKDYVPEYAASPGDWQQVTFNHAIDMSTGNYVSPGYMTDDNSQKMGEFFGAQPYAERIKAAFDCPHAAEPGTRWVYRTSDTFILTRALHNYLQGQQGPGADIFQFVVDEVYRPLGLGPGAFTTMRTADDNWQGQAEGGYGLWWIPDDMAKIGTLLIRDGGRIDGVQVLHPDLLAAALQRDPGDRGVRIDSRRMYNNAFWANRYTKADGFACEFWVPQMLGVSGNVVALFPNGVTYYYFSDNQEFTWDAALRQSDKISPLCPAEAHLPPAPTAQSATPTPATAAPSDNPADGLIAFYSERDGNPEIYTIQADGRGLARLTDDPAVDDSPALSPDGRQIAFLTARHDPNPHFPDLKYEICVVDVDGRNLRRLTDTGAAEDHPAWSPDGSKILFDADYDGDGYLELYSMSAAGTGVTRLTFNQANDQFGDWSPDGRHIAFSSDRSGNWDLYVMNADGSDQQPLTTSPDWELFPAWSPDGSQIAFNGLRPGSRNTDVYLLNRDGSDLRRLTNTPGFDENPAWSPDGTQIAFQTARDGNFEIYVMNPDGSDQHPLAAHPADELWPSWGPAAGP